MSTYLLLACNRFLAAPRGASVAIMTDDDIIEFATISFLEIKNFQNDIYKKTPF